MPRKPLKPKSRISSGLTGSQITCLIEGSVLIGAKKPEDCFGSWDAAKEAWSINRNYIMSLMGQVIPAYAMTPYPNLYFEYGTRPHFWWVCDSTGERRFLHYEKLTFVSDDTPCWAFRRVNYKTRFPVYESEFDYLTRLDLLLPEEAEKYFEQEEKKKQDKVDCRNRLKGADLEE